jgi:hypothetical protein
LLEILTGDTIETELLSKIIELGLQKIMYAERERYIVVNNYERGEG